MMGVLDNLVPYNHEGLVGFLDVLGNFAPEREKVLLPGEVVGELLGHLHLEDEVPVVALRVEEATKKRRKDWEPAARYLAERGLPAGLFVFHDGKGAYRLSLVHARYRGTRKPELSHYKRHSLIARPGEPNKTFFQRLRRMAENPPGTLAELLEIFSVEAVTAGPGSSGYTVGASYQGGLAGFEVEGALHVTSFAVPSPLYKAALGLRYRVPLGVAVLAPKGFVGLVRGGGLPEDTLLYRAALEAQAYGWTLEAAYGSLKTSAEGWPADGKDRSFDPWYPGFFDGVPQAAAERRGFSVRAAYQGFEVVYHALFFPAQEHVLALGHTLR